MTKSFFRSFQLLAFCIIIGTQVNAQKFGFVNSQTILAEMPAVKQADADIEALQKQLQKKGQNMATQFQKDVEALQQKVERGELSPKQQQEESAKLENRQKEISKFEQEMANQLQEKRSEWLKPIYDKVNTAISDVAKENGFFMIFDVAILLYADDALDVSKLVKAKLGF